MAYSRRYRFVGLVVLVFLLGSLHDAVAQPAASTLSFPKLLNPAELGSTGLALVNTGSATATGSLTFFAAGGNVLGTTTQSIPPGGQLSKLGSELFPGMTMPGWIQLTSSTAGLRGFEITGDFATFTDGAGPANPASDQILPVATANTEINVANTSSTALIVSITLMGRNGSSMGNVTRNLATLGALQSVLSDLFPSADFSLAGYVRLTSTAPFAATSVVRGFLVQVETAIINGIGVSSARQDLTFPYTPSGPLGFQNWATEISVTNLGTAAQTVTLAFTRDNGQATTVQRSIPANGSLQESAASLFSLTAGQFTPGWVRVTGTGNLLGVAAYAETVSGQVAVVPVQAVPAARLLFGHIADLSPWYTGIALLCGGTTAANVEVFAIEPSGRLIGRVATLTLNPNQRTSFLLSELVPETAQRTSDGGFVFVRSTNNVPLYGLELFGNVVSPILANVESFEPLATYAPPTSGGGATPALTIDRVYTTNLVNVPTTAFVPGDPILYWTDRTNSTTAAATNDIRYTATGPNGFVLLNRSVSSSFPTGQSQRFLADLLPANALNGTYTFTGSLTYLGQVSSKSATFTVSNGATAPSVAPDEVSTRDTSDRPKTTFAAGETVRLQMIRSNTFPQEVMGDVRYLVTGPGNVVTFDERVTGDTIASGYSTRSIDRVIPANSVPGVYSFTGSITVAGVTTNKTATFTVAGANTSSTVTLERTLVASSTGVPKNVVSAGDAVRLYASAFSTMTTPQLLALRLFITGPGNTTVTSQNVTYQVTPGYNAAFLNFTIPSNASGQHTLNAALTLPGGAIATQTFDFNVGNGQSTFPAAATIEKAYMLDGNFVPRSVFLTTEAARAVLVLLSAFPQQVSGAEARFQVTGPAGSLTDVRTPVTLNPGFSSQSNAISLLSATPGTHTLTVTFTASGQTVTQSVPFTVQAATPSTESDAKEPLDLAVDVQLVIEKDLAAPVTPEPVFRKLNRRR